MRYCAAVGCNNGSSSEENKKYVKEKGITFHKFPLADRTRLQAWLARVSRKGFQPTEYSALCSEHFEQEDFAYQNFTGARRIKDGAIPTVFLHKERKAKRQRTSYTFAEPAVREVAEPTKKDVECQTDLTSDQIGMLHEEMRTKNTIIAALQERIKNQYFSLQQMSSDNVKTLTGFSSKVFFIIFNFFCLETVLPKTLKSKLTPANVLFLTLIRLRQGLSENLLALLFDIGKTTVNRNFNACLDVMYTASKTVNIWPDKQTTQFYMPASFKHYFPNCRVVIDCTEFYTQKPSNPKQQQASWSNYKNHNTYKSLIGMLPSGAICFISDLWLGSISDKALTLSCGIMDKLEENNLVLADRGFTVLEEELKKRKIQLETPYFLSNKIQFDLQERSENKTISHHRVHVERAIGRIKNFKILNNIIPTTLKSIDKIHYLCAFLSNFSEEPLIKITKH